MFVGLANLTLAIIIGLFDVLTFGVFRRRFKRVLVHFPKTPSETELKQIIADSAAIGGLPRRYIPFLKQSYYSNGFWLLRTGAYLVLPALLATILVVLLQPESNFIFYAPIVTFAISILFILLGNYLVGRKTRTVATMK